MTTQFRLGDAIPRDAIEGACDGLGFRLSNVVARAAAHPAQLIFASADRRTALHLIDDAAAGRAVIFRGDRAEDAAAAFLAALGARVSEAPSQADTQSASAPGSPAIERTP